MKNHKDDLLRRHQTVLYELLEVFDAICRKHNIQYLLFAGTALGAVRHKGIIPWDDDLDVVMLRSEYEKFMSFAPGELEPDKYFLQVEFSEHWPMFFSKLRKNDTACLERYIPKDEQTHQGVYIDIFPCDNLADSNVLRKAQFFASKIIIAKSLDRRGYLTDSVRKKLFMAVCRFMPRKLPLKLVQLRGADTSDYVHTFLGGASQYEKNIYPRKWFTETMMLPFERGLFPVSAHYDELLTALYGDYMTPLPETQRGCKVHAELVDLDHSYTQYLDQQKQMHFDELSRSIR